MKIHHGAIVDNVVTYMCMQSLATTGCEVKEALAFPTTRTRRTTTTLVALGQPSLAVKMSVAIQHIIYTAH